MSDSVRPHRQQPTRLPHPRNSPSKNGVGCHFLLQCMKVKSESDVAQSCPTLSDPMDCSLPGSSIHGILQARVLEWGPIAFAFSSYLISKISLLSFSASERKIIIVFWMIIRSIDGVNELVSAKQPSLAQSKQLINEYYYYYCHYV